MSAMYVASNDARSPWRHRRRPLARCTSMTRVRLGATTAGAVVVLATIFVALVWKNYQLVLSHVQSKPWLYGGLFLWSVWSAVQRVRHQWGSVVVDCVHKVDDVMMRVSSSQAMTRIKSSVSSMGLMDFGREAAMVASPESRSPKVAHSTCFLALDAISALSLTDIKDLVQYAMQVNQPDFDGKRFAGACSRPCRQAMQAMDLVVVASRGSLATLSVAGGDDTFGDMDALVFMAFVRIFAEWRSLRLVPDGYQGYAVGMGLAKRDLVQNTLKVETAVHVWMEDHDRNTKVRSGRSQQLSTPTLRQLLIWERDTNMHQRLPKLREKSGASGLLWILRQLRYQTAIFDNLTKVPMVYPMGKDAVAAAYDATYHKYHGFLVQQIFKRSFDAAPGADDILSHMCQGQQCLQRADSSDSDAMTEEMTSDDESIPSDVPKAPLVPHEPSPVVPNPLKEHAVMCMKNPLDQFTDHIVSEWMKLERFMSQCNGSHVDSSKSRNVLVGPTSSVVNMTGIMPAMKRSSVAAAEEEIPVFIAAMHPILRGLDKMIHHLNMNDPSKC